MNHYCYKIILEGSDLFYTGRKSTTKDIDKCTYMGSGKWVKSIKDKSRLTKIILGVYDNIHDLKDAEQAFIDQWFDDPNCMNFLRSSYGSAPGVHHQYYGKTGELAPNYGRTGELAPRYGNKHSEESKQKISKGNKGKSRSKEHRRKISDGRTGKYVGINSPRVKLKESQVREILERYAAGRITQKELAEEYGVDRGHISKIITRQSWKHLEL